MTVNLDELFTETIIDIIKFESISVSVAKVVYNIDTIYEYILLFK